MIIDLMGQKFEPEPEVIVITGGLERDASGDFAQFGDAFLKRTDGESVEVVSNSGARCCPCCGGRICQFRRVAEDERQR